MSKKDLTKAKDYLGQINPNLLIGGAIVGLVGLGGVLLWRALDPSRKWEEFKTYTQEHYETFYTKTDPKTGETKPDKLTIGLATISPAFGIFNYLRKRGDVPSWSNNPPTPGTGPDPGGVNP